ncbi:MAG TPA: hypothetical protein VK820_01620 [Steroidobacteraceae bacterium]|jgi:hypothetical protein|nr:hypothetical protein [Steroidobacteraceae bacterium]
MKTRGMPVAEEMAGPSWSAQPWLGGATLNVLAELNEQSLSLLAEEAAQPATSPHPLLRDLAPLWSKLDAPALKRAAACPYLLLDTGFADPQRWLWVQGAQVLERERGPVVPFFTSPRARILLRTVLTYGWHLVQNRQSAARLLLGMSPQCVSLVRACTLIQVADLAETHPAWLQPRWPQQVRIWREFLSAAVAGEGPSLQQARLRGLQILAADARAAGGG